MDTIDIVQLGTPPRDGSKVARWASSVGGTLAKLKQDAESGQVELYYDQDQGRRAFAKLGEISGVAISLEIRSQRTRPGVKLILHEGQRERPLLVISGQVRDLAKGLLTIAERQYKEKQQQIG